MKVTFFCLLLVLINMYTGQAQERPTGRPTGSVSIGLAYTQPRSGFRQYYPNGHAAGTTFGFTVRPQAGYAPLELGAEVSYLLFGIEKHTIGSGSNAYYLKTTHSFIPLHGLVRLKPGRLTTFNPYLDALAGISIFNSRTKVDEDFFTFLRDEEPLVIKKHTSVVFNYGLAAGLMYAVNNRKSFFADLRLIYLESPLASYVKKGDVFIDQNGDAAYHLTRSETSMFMVQLKLTGIIKSMSD
jgi:hypothetical protein